MDDEFEEDEFDVEASRRMAYCDSCGPSVAAKMHIIIDGYELKFCFHHTTKYRAKLNNDGAFIYELSA